MEKIFFQNSKEKEFDAINCMHVDVQICLNYDSEKITTDKKIIRYRNCETGKIKCHEDFFCLM